MPNHSSAKKAMRSTAYRTIVNRSKYSRILTAIKAVLKAVKENDKKEAAKAFATAESQLMKGVTKNLLKLNTAARRVSRLSAKVRAIQE